MNVNFLLHFAKCTILSQLCLKGFKPTVCVNVRHTGVNTVNSCTTFLSAVCQHKNQLQFNQAICCISYCHSIQHKQTFLCSLGLYIESYSQKSVQFGWCNLHGAITSHRNCGIDSLNDREEHYNQPFVQHGVDKHTFGILKSRFR